MDRQKGIIPILILLVVAGIVAVLFIFGKDKLSSFIKIGTPVPSATSPSNTISNWKTYVSKTGNTSIKYPPDWAYREYETGVAFYVAASGDKVGSEPITMGINNKALDDINLPFAEYAKVAAIHEIQNYLSLSSITPVTTLSGITGYSTTWKVAPMPGTGGTVGDSLPITYFPIPNLNSSDIQVSIGNKEFLSIYNEMIKTVSIKPQNPTSSSTPSNLNTYTNSQYGFELTFPDSWNGYKISQHSNPNWDDMCFYFDMPGSQSFCILQFEIYTPAQWAVAKAAMSASQLKNAFISQNQNAYIIYADYNLARSQENDFQWARLQEVPQILSTFKFTQ